MTFYNRNNQKITQDEWVELYEPYYFLGGPTYGRSIPKRRQGSKFVEEKIEEILKKGLQQDELTLIVAWKIGAIDHKVSELKGEIIFLKNFDETFEFPDQYGRIIKAKEIIEYCQKKFSDITKKISNAELLYDDLEEHRGQKSYFGMVKLLALLYFFTQRHWPIYDQFAHRAVEAITADIKHDEPVGCYNQIGGFKEYREKYVEKIKNIFRKQDIGRNVDRALWVYGHFFNKDNNCNTTIDICRSQKKNKKS